MALAKGGHKRKFQQVKSNRQDGPIFKQIILSIRRHIEYRSVYVMYISAVELTYNTTFYLGGRTLIFNSISNTINLS